MFEVIWSADFITEENRTILETTYNNRQFGLTDFKVGLVVVVQTINSSDPFDPRMGIRNENCWLVTREEFDSKFTIKDDDNKTDTFAIITPK